VTDSEIREAELREEVLRAREDFLKASDPERAKAESSYLQLLRTFADLVLNG